MAEENSPRTHHHLDGQPEENDVDDYNDLEVADYLARAIQTRPITDECAISTSSCSSLGSHEIVDHAKSSTVMTNVPRGNAAAVVSPLQNHTGVWSINELAFRGELTDRLLTINDDCIDSVDSDSGCTPLITASSCGWTHVVELLLSHDANVELRDRRGASALMHASSGGHQFVVAALLERGADVNAADASGNTALHYAVFFQHISCVSLLLSAGADITLVNKDRLSPPALAARLGYVTVQDAINRHVLSLFND